MNKTKIEWCDYTINPIKGLCPMGCSYCYARAMYKRFGWDFEIREDISVYDQLDKMKPGSKVFVGSTMELFGSWVTGLMRSNIYHVIECYPGLIFIFLTKQPHNLPKDWPDNCWVGISAENTANFQQRTSFLPDIQAGKLFVSLEPLLEWNMGVSCLQGYLEIRKLDWLIIGAQTKPYKPPKIEWVNEIVMAADKARVPIFLKDNLRYIQAGYPRQEFPA